MATLPPITDLSAAVQAPGLSDDPGVTWTTPVSDTFSMVEVITGVARRRRFTTERKLAVVEEKRQTEWGSSTWKPHEQGRDPELLSTSLV